jgi:hypothetical protein
VQLARGPVLPAPALLPFGSKLEGLNIGLFSTGRTGFSDVWAELERCGAAVGGGAADSKYDGVVIMPAASVSTTLSYCGRALEMRCPR